MSHDLPLRGPALHNPQLLSKRELVDGFVVRTALLERIADDLRAAHEQPFSHRLVLGQRGMGKTTLLHRIRYLIEDDPTLSGWLPLVFPEEQYNVDRLSAFWMNCLDALGDALEARGQGAEALDDAVQALNALPEPERAARALALLLQVATEHNKRLLLLVDNVDLVLKRLEADQWAVRETLSHQQRLALIGASSQVLEASYHYDAAFYEFFELDELVGLTADETRTLLLHLAQRHGAPAVAKIVREHPERVEPLRLLTGGNPRTLALLYTVLAQGPDGDVRTDLEQLLDRCTPLYKARFEELSDQAQTILAELAVHWHPIGSADLSARCRLESRTVTGQLDRLAKAGIVQKVPLATDQGRRKQLGYQVAERFFNIWYLMRASRRVRRRLVWLVEFLRLMHTPDERRDGARAHLGRPHAGERVLLFAEAEQALYNAEPAPIAAELRQELGASGALTLATALVATGHIDQAEAPMKRVLVDGDDDLHTTHWDLILRFFAIVAHKGHAGTAREWLDRWQVGERWLPLRTALQVLAVDDEDVLFSVAPEVAQASRQVLTLLRAPVLARGGDIS